MSLRKSGLLAKLTSIILIVLIIVGLSPTGVLVAEASDYSKAVVDRYNNSIQWTEHYTVNVKIPKITLSGLNFSKVNDEIWKYCYTDNNYGGTSQFRPSWHISYSWAVNNNKILSLVCKRGGVDAPGDFYKVYNLNLPSGTRMSKSAVIKAAGMTESAFNSKVKKAVCSYFKNHTDDSYYQSNLENLKRYNNQLSKTLSSSNVAEAIPYFNSKGQLCVIAKVYSVVQSDFYWRDINLETFVAVKDYDKKGELKPYQYNLTLADARKKAKKDLSSFLKKGNGRTAKDEDVTYKGFTTIEEGYDVTDIPVVYYRFTCKVSSDFSYTLLVDAKTGKVIPNTGTPYYPVITDICNSVKLQISGMVNKKYDGNVKTQSLTVKANGKTLKQGSDYVLRYKNNKAVGQATVDIIGVGKYGGKVSKTFNIVTGKWKRLYGQGRYDTMKAIVDEGFKSKGGTVIVATGTGFKDALAACGLAGLYDAPIVLTDGKNLSSQAKKILQKLKPSKVYVAGGKMAVSNDVLSQINSATGVKAKRIAGSTSSETSAKLALAGKGRWSSDKVAVIATNKSFKDALSVAPIAYANKYPILLADNGQSLSKAVLDALKELGIKNVIIVGGTGAVSENVESQLAKKKIKVKKRLGGKNGVETSSLIAKYGLSNGLSVDKMGVATSQNFPDALAGAALCGHNKSILVLADDKAMTNAGFPKPYRTKLKKGYIFGGTSAVGNKTFTKLDQSVA